jgi:selenocysteine lyase/cysteine desulfurase
MTSRVPYGTQMRKAHFGFASSFTPLNHGSYGATPLLIEQRQREIQKREIERPDPFIIYDLPSLLDESRQAVAPLLGAAVDEVVLIPNASTGVNTVLRNLKFEEKDVIVHFSTIYDACERAIDSISALTPLAARSIPLQYPIEDDEIVEKFRAMVQKVRHEGCKVKIAMFDTVLTFPGVPMPWEALTRACKELEILSLLDGAHGIGHIDLKHLGSVSPDFFVSNCHK